MRIFTVELRIGRSTSCPRGEKKKCHFTVLTEAMALQRFNLMDTTANVMLFTMALSNCVILLPNSLKLKH